MGIWPFKSRGCSSPFNSPSLQPEAEYPGGLRCRDAPGRAGGAGPAAAAALCSALRSGGRGGPGGAALAPGSPAPAGAAGAGLGRGPAAPGAGAGAGGRGRAAEPGASPAAAAGRSRGAGARLRDVPEAAPAGGAGRCGRREPGPAPGARALLLSACSSEPPLQGSVLYLDILGRAHPEALSPLGTARFSWAPGHSLPAAAWPLPTLYCAPPAEAGTVPSRAAALYVQLLFALRQRALRVLEAGLVSELYDALGLLRAGWEGLAQDLASGRLSRRLELPAETRRQLDARLAPDTARAAVLRAECARGWDGLALRLWPRLRVVVAAEPSSEQFYGDALRAAECRGLPFYSPFYGAAGAVLGINLWPEQPDTRYLLCPGWAFCEFLPVGPGSQEPPETLLLSDVCQGQEYELVLTAQPGLYRCRVGEVLKVSGFHNQCPVVQPVRRLSQTLSVRGEGIPEEGFHRSLRRAVALWPGARLVDYVCAESSLLGASSGACAPHYQVFVELQGLRDLSEGQRYKLDQCLQEDFPVYKSFRFKGSVGPLRLHLVAAGAFMELRDAVGLPAPMARVLRETRPLHFIQSRVIS